jgi:hypothetical protein
MHERIVDAIESGGPDAASATVRTHMQQIVPSLPEIARKFPDMFASRRTA